MTDCILWQGAPQQNGYGQVTKYGRKWTAHRLAYYEAHGPIPKGLLVCHTCDNRLCVNVEHLFLGTARDNMQDAKAKGRMSKKPKSVCKNGHEMTPENTYLGPKSRECQTCRKQRRLRYLHGRQVLVR